MPFIAFLGCDGSGKSAVIAAVTAELENQGHRVIRGHWRPAPFAKQHQATASADDPHGLPPRGLVTSILKLAWLWLNWWTGWFIGLRAASTSGYVIFDRYHADLLVDPHRYRYGGPMWLARLASRTMPQPDRVFFLDAPPDVLLSRKQEVGHEALELSRSAYLTFTRRSRKTQIIDASYPLEQVTCEVMISISLLDIRDGLLLS